MDVRIFGHRGLEQLPVMLAKQFSSDSVYQLVYPYEFKQTLTTNGLTPVASASDAGTETRLLRIEVPDGESIRFEVNPPGRAVVASAGSPILAGINQIYFRTGYTISIIDAAST